MNSDPIKEQPARAGRKPRPPLTDEDRESYLKYVLATVGTPEELAADRAWWTDEMIQEAMDQNL